MGRYVKWGCNTFRWRSGSSSWKSDHETRLSVFVKILRTHKSRRISFERIVANMRKKEPWKSRMGETSDTSWLRAFFAWEKSRRRKRKTADFTDVVQAKKSRPHP